MPGKCCICGNEHERYRDRTHTTFASYCAPCHAAYNRATRPKHSELAPLQRQRANARAYANHYLNSGKRSYTWLDGEKLTRKPCENCGEEKVQMHHEDYSKPLHVTWLCKRCHVKHHLKQKKVTP